MVHATWDTQDAVVGELALCKQAIKVQGKVTYEKSKIITLHLRRVTNRDPRPTGPSLEEILKAK